MSDSLALHYCYMVQASFFSWFSDRELFYESVKAQVVLGAALVLVAVILLVFGLPVMVFSIDSACPPYSYMGDCSNVEELSMSLFGVAFAIGGIALIATSFFPERQKN
ncbi:MAG: hypothetical protein AB1351_07190 [Thermoproteota archaeon]